MLTSTNLKWFLGFSVEGLLTNRTINYNCPQLMLILAHSHFDQLLLLYELL